jgi:hypothetical protein
MNDQIMENLLRKAPSPKAPAGLAKQIMGNIRLPRVELGQAEWKGGQPWFKRWLPAVSFAVLLLSCVVVIGMETHWLADLRGQNEALRAKTQDLDALREANKEVRRLQSENGELERLQKDSAELARLRKEMADLQTQADGLAGLRADNDKLKLAAAAIPTLERDFFAEREADAERIQCCNNLKWLCLSVRIWQGDHQNFCPTNVISMTNEMSNWKILQCPSDHVRKLSSWADLGLSSGSYQYFGAGLKEGDDPNTIIFECPIHHNVGLLNGAVQQLNPKAYAERIKMVDGRKVFVDN